MKGFLGNLENPDYLDAYPIAILCAVMENIPSYSEECSSLLAPYLLHYIRKENTIVDCIDGFAACAVYGGPCFDKYCGPAVTILLQLNDVRNAPSDLVSPDNNMNCTEVELHACAALFRISVYREHALQGTAAKMLEMCFESLPFTLYCDQAKVEHKLFIDLLEHKDIRLLGPTGRVENLAQVCTYICCTVLYFTALYCTVLYCTVLYWTALYCTLLLYCTVQYCTVLYSTVLYCTVLYCTVLYCTVLHCTVLHCTVLYCTVLYCTVLYCTVLYCTVLYCTVLYGIF